MNSITGQRVGHWGLVVFVLALVLLPFIFNSDYIIHLLIMIAIYGILAQSLNLLLGFTGLVSFSQLGFYAIGAYSSSLMVMKAGIPFWISVPVAASLAAGLGYLIGLIALRFKHHVFVLVTLALGELIRLAAFNLGGFTGGPDGIFNIPRPSPIVLGTLKIDFTSLIPYYFVVLIAIIMVVAILVKIARSGFGRSLVAIRENDVYAEFIGINVWRTKVYAFTIGAAMAGFAGGFYAHYISYISPYSFTVFESVNVLIMVILGGKGTIVGPIIGTAFLQTVPELLRAISDYRMLIYGLVLVLVVLFLPNGLIGLFQRRKEQQTVPYPELHGLKDGGVMNG
ncbi:MAG: branched-chain amino acid ABC transporter permease [Bacillota bacterium]